MRINFSKSGAILPIINPVIDRHFEGKKFNGKTAAGWEKVKGIKIKKANAKNIIA